MEGEKEGSLQTDKSVVTGEQSRQFFGSELLGLGIAATETASSEWTDEKHGLYLSFIEASFVNQLYNLEHSSVYPLGWGPLRQQESLSNNLLQSTQTNSSGQFKVLRKGCWQKLKFDNGQTQVHCGNESHHILQNPWIQHFRHLPGNQQHETTVPNLQLQVSPIREVAPLAGHCGKSTNQQPGVTKLRHTVYCQTSSTVQNAEVSDQNFVDGSCSCGEDLMTSSCGRKRVVSYADSAADDFTSQRQDSNPCKRRQGLCKCELDTVLHSEMYEIGHFGLAQTPGNCTPVQQ